MSSSTFPSPSATGFSGTSTSTGVSTTSIVSSLLLSGSSSPPWFISKPSSRLTGGCGTLSSLPVSSPSKSIVVGFSGSGSTGSAVGAGSIGSIGSIGLGSSVFCGLSVVSSSSPSFSFISLILNAEIRSKIFFIPTTEFSKQNTTTSNASTTIMEYAPIPPTRLRIPLKRKYPCLPPSINRLSLKIDAKAILNQSIITALFIMNGNMRTFLIFRSLRLITTSIATIANDAMPKVSRIKKFAIMAPNFPALFSTCMSELNKASKNP